MASDSDSDSSMQRQRRRSSIAAGAALVAGGLGLTFLGGCFLIGVLLITERMKLTGIAFTTSDTVLMSALYAVASACFVGAIALLIVGTRGLVRHLQN